MVSFVWISGRRVSLYLGRLVTGHSLFCSWLALQSHRYCREILNSQTFTKKLIVVGTIWFFIFKKGKVCCCHWIITVVLWWNSNALHSLTWLNKFDSGWPAKLVAAECILLSLWRILHINTSQFYISVLASMTFHLSQVQLQMRSLLFWDVTPCRLVVGYKHFETTYWSCHQGSSSLAALPQGMT